MLIRILVRLTSAVALALSAGMALAADFPAPKEGDWIIRDFRFRSGEVLPELRIHCRLLRRRMTPLALDQRNP